MSVRPANETDIPSLIQISLRALRHEPTNIYRFPYMDDYPQEYEANLLKRYKFFWGLEGTKCAVYEVDDEEKEEEKEEEEEKEGNGDGKGGQVNDGRTMTTKKKKKKKVVAYAIWTLPVPVPVPVKKEENGERKDGKDEKDEAPIQQIQKQPTPFEDYTVKYADPARMKAFNEAMTKAKLDIFKSKYGDQYMYMGILETHPDYQRRGAGRMLVKYGIEMARENGWPVVTLFSSGVGFPFYRAVGFERIGGFRVQIEGEEEFVDVPGMAYVV